MSEEEIEQALDSAWRNSPSSDYPSFADGFKACLALNRRTPAAQGRVLQDGLDDLKRWADSGDCNVPAWIPDGVSRLIDDIRAYHAAQADASRLLAAARFFRSGIDDHWAVVFRNDLATHDATIAEYEAGLPEGAHPCAPGTVEAAQGRVDALFDEPE